MNEQKQPAVAGPVELVLGPLPPLPPKRVINRHLPTGVALHGYNADDMRAYAGAAVAAAVPDTDGLVWALHYADNGRGRMVSMMWDTEEQAKAFVQWCQGRIGTLDAAPEVPR